jgi:hypothetical protein
MVDSKLTRQDVEIALISSLNQWELDDRDVENIRGR